MAANIATPVSKQGWLSRDSFRAICFGLLIVLLFSVSIAYIPSTYQPYAYGLSYLLVTFGFIRALWKGKVIDAFSPAIISFALLFTYSIASAINATATGSTTYGDLIPREVFDKFYIACLVGLFGLGVGFLISDNLKVSTWIPGWIKDNQEDKRFHRRVWVYGGIIAAILATSLQKGFDFTNVESYYTTALLSRVLRMELGEAQGLRDYFLYLAPLTLVLVGALLLMFRTRNLIWRLIGVAILSCHLYTALLSGWRSSIIFLACFCLVFIHYRVKRISLSWLAVLAVFGVISVSVLSYLRYTSDPVEMIKRAQDLTQSENAQALNITSSGEMLTGQNLFRLIKGLDNGETQYTNGESFLTETLVFIPREFYPNRPLPMAEQFVSTFYPGVLEAGGGYGFFYIMEGYWAFGFLGVFLTMGLYGGFMNVIYRWCIANMKCDAVALLYGIALYPLAMYAVRSGMIISIKTMLMDVMPIVLVMVLPNLSKRSKNSGETA